MRFGYEFGIEVRKVVSIEAETEEEAADMARKMLHDCPPEVDLSQDNFDDWWATWSGVYDEQGNLMDEVLV